MAHRPVEENSFQNDEALILQTVTRTAEGSYMAALLKGAKGRVDQLMPCYKGSA